MNSKPHQPQTTSKNQGEGDREAARHYNDDQQSFVRSGKAREAARRAAPADAAQAEELERAEREGLAHAKGEDPTVPGANAAIAGARAARKQPR